MIDPFVLTNYIASKICHDIVSPISVVSNALEMLDMPIDASNKREYESLMRETMERVVPMVEFLRFVFGSQGLSNGQADIPALKRLAVGYAQGSDVTIDWHVGDAALSFAQMRVLLSQVQIGVDALSRGGTLSASVQRDGGLITLSVAARSGKVSMREDIAQALEGREPKDGWQAKNIQVLWARLLAERAGGTLVFTGGPGALHLSVSNVPALQQA
jgi:histidine phosphotransferase ChpT